MKFVYIAGPYSGPEYLTIDRHISNARQAAAWCAEHDIGYFCPHLNSAHFDAIVPDVPVGWWYDMDLHFLAACEAILVLPGWRESNGTLVELGVAKSLAMPVFRWPVEIDRIFEWSITDNKEGQA